MGKLFVIFFILFPNLVLTEELGQSEIYDNLNKIGDNALPGNPLNDRAKGYLVAGKAKTATQTRKLKLKLKQQLKQHNNLSRKVATSK